MSSSLLTSMGIRNLALRRRIGQLRHAAAIALPFVVGSVGQVREAAFAPLRSSRTAAIAQAIEWSLATPRINPFLPSNRPIRVLPLIDLPRAVQACSATVEWPAGQSWSPSAHLPARTHLCRPTRVRQRPGRPRRRARRIAGCGEIAQCPRRWPAAIPARWRRSDSRRMYQIDVAILPALAYN